MLYLQVRNNRNKSEKCEKFEVQFWSDDDSCLKIFGKNHKFWSVESRSRIQSLESRSWRFHHVSVLNTGEGCGHATAPQKFWFGENAGKFHKIRRKSLATFTNSLKIWAKMVPQLTRRAFFWRSLLFVVLFSGKLGEFEKNFFATPKICLHVHLWSWRLRSWLHHWLVPICVLCEWTSVLLSPFGLT